MATTLYTAAVVLPMSGPPLAAGGVLVTGDQIVAVAEADGLRADGQRTQHVDGVLLPGLVNGHTHLEHADAAGLARPGPFPTWLRAVAGTTRAWEADRWSRSARRGVAQALHHGTTAVDDIVHQGAGVPAAARAGLHGTSWIDVRDVDHREIDDVGAAVAHALGLPATGRRLGIAPHATYSLGTGPLQALVALARRHGAPLRIEVGATGAESAAITHGTGPLAEAARAAGLAFEWLEGGTGLAPIAYLDACGALGPQTTVTHAVWVDQAEAGLLAQRGVTVVVCPRASERLQGGEPPLERFADAGLRVALGTDGPAAVGSLDLLAEAAAWVRLARARGLAMWSGAAGPVSLEEQAVRLVTVEGAAALGIGDRAGLLEPGRRADLCGVALTTTPLTAYRDLVEQGGGRQVLTVLGGVRKARRASTAVPWPEHDDSWRDAS